MSDFVLQNGHYAHLDCLFQERIAAGLAGDLSFKSVAAIVEEEMLLPIPEDWRPKPV